MKPDITLITSAYNAEKFIGSTIASVQTQTYSNFQWVIIDDASTDATAEIITLAAKKDPRIHFIRHAKNQGLTHSLNEAITLVKTTYLARIDADDLCKPERLAIQRQTMVQNPSLVLCGSWAEIIDGEGNVTDVYQPQLSSNTLQTLFLHNPFIHSSWFANTTLFKKSGGYNPSYRQAQDYELLFRLRRLGEINIIPQVLVSYRNYLGSVSHTKMTRSLRYALQARYEALRRNDVPAWYVIFLIKPFLSLFVPVAWKQRFWRTSS